MEYILSTAKQKEKFTLLIAVIKENKLILNFIKEAQIE